MKSAVVKITINSSYVLIIINPFPQDSKRVRARPPAARVSILYCQGAGAADQGGGVWLL